MAVENTQGTFIELVAAFIVGGSPQRASRREAVAALQLCSAAKFGMRSLLSCWGFRALLHHESAVRRWAAERADSAQDDLRRIARLVRSNTNGGPRGDAVERVTALIANFNVDHATLGRLLRERPELADVTERIRRQASYWQGDVASDIDTTDEDEDDAEGDEP